MTRLRKRFVQLWERQLRTGVRLPAAFCFIRGEGQDEWRCYYGPVGKVRRSRVFVDHSAVYGFLSAKELLQNGSTRWGRAPARPLPAAGPTRVTHNRFIRCRIIDRIKKQPFVPAARPAVSGVPAAATGMIAAEASGSEPISLL